MALCVDIFEDVCLKNANWICVLAKSGHEFYAACNLEKERFEIYLPIAKIANSTRVYYTPLFGVYLFVKLDDKLPKLRAVDGIAGIITRDNEPVRVQDNVIAELRSRECNGVIEIAQAPKLGSKFWTGAPVRIIQGAHGGLNATFERMLSAQRACVSLFYLGSLRSVTLPMSALAVG